MSIKKVQITYEVPIPSKRVDRFQFAPHVGPNITILSGGSGTSTLARQLKQYSHNSTHILTMFDDGGSSKTIRETFNIPPPGDLRNRLMCLADESDQGRPEIIEVFTHRLPNKEYIPGSLQHELDSMIRGSHPKMKAVEPGLANIICLYLKKFDQIKPDSFNLRGASIGNLVMVGCYYLHGNSYENAIYLLASLARVRGSVIPVTLANCHLGAKLSDGTIIYGQAHITKQKNRYASPINSVFFVENKTEGTPEVNVAGNPRAIFALSDADVIVYSMGSFYTSLLPCLMTQGISTAIRQAKVPKVLLANSTVDDESRDLTVSKMLSNLVSTCQKHDPQSGKARDYVQYVITNAHGATSEYRGRKGYIPVDHDSIIGMGIDLLEYPLEKSRGNFDTDILSRIILSFAHL